MSNKDWALAKVAILELANYVVTYGIDDKDESIFNSYLDRCTELNESPCDAVLLALGRKEDLSRADEATVVYDYKVTEIKTEGFFVVNVSIERDKEPTPEQLIEKVRWPDGGWLYDYPKITQIKIIEDTESAKIEPPKLITRLLGKKPLLITKQVSFFLSGTLPGDVINENEDDLMSMISGRYLTNPAFNHRYLLTESLQISDDDIILVPV